jgi:hypothetical protein
MMKRLLVLAALAALALPTAALAKGPDEAKITGPGLAKAIVISGPEEDGSPMMAFAEAAGFFPAAFGQQPDPMLSSRPKGDLGPRYTIAYNVPGGEGTNYSLSQDLYPYAQPYAVTYMKAGQQIFDMTTRGGWWTDSSLKDQLVALGLPKTAAAAESSDSSSSSAGFFSTGRLGALVLVLLILGGATIVMRRRFRGDAAA